MLEAVEELGYEPLRRVPAEPGTATSTGTAIITSTQHITIFSVAIAQISAVLAEHGSTVSIHLGETAEQRWEVAARLHGEKHTRGFILLGSTEVTVPAWARRASVVILGEVPPNERRRAWTVRLDNAHAGRLVADYLWSLGHRRAGIAGVLEPTYTRERIAAFGQRWKTLGGEFGDHLLFDFRPGDLATVGTILQSNLPGFLSRAASDHGPLTALFCMNDVQAACTIRTLREIGLKVPQDMSIAGVDDWPLLAESVDPALTTVRQPFAVLGRMAATLLLERLSGSRKPREVVLPGELVVRGSCGPAPTRGVMPGD